jgi:predicted lipoprotein with Yx(FWY)xxD motif
VALAVPGLVVLAACGSSAKNTTASGTTTPLTVSTPLEVATTTTSATGPTVKTASSALGTILVDAQGFTLYHFDKDTGTTVACTAGCTQVWPPLVAPSGSPVAGPGVSGLGSLARPDGIQQVTYSGKTLYRYSGDSKAGDTHGQGIGGVWHVVTTGAATGTTPSSAGGSGY